MLLVIVSAMVQKKKMKFMISFLSLMVQDWFQRGPYQSHSHFRLKNSTKLQNSSFKSLRLQKLAFVAVKFLKALS